jgi:hypothetical protein
MENHVKDLYEEFDKKRKAFDANEADLKEIEQLGKILKKR